jgi:polygalacturonase
MISSISRRWLLLLGFSTALGALPAAAADRASGDFNVRDFGATGDGKTLDTDAINKAIDAASAAGGGTVIFPAGTYVSASIHLKSHLRLFLGAGATIEAADPSIAKFDNPEPNEWGDKYQYQDFGHSHWHNSLIWGEGLEDISIVGPGLIHGKGLSNGFDRFAKRTGDKDRRYLDPAPGIGNKAIALRDCRNVILRDFSILHGGHFGILATGVNNLTIDNLKIDTNRDGMDIDGCLDVRVTHCAVNSPWDDGICLKASYGLGRVAHCDNVTISDCYVCASFDEGTLLDGTFKISKPEYRSNHTGRIKLGTESNGDFKNIAITNCIFDGCRGLAIESVDGSHIEDVVISNLTMRHVAEAPLFIRLGSRMRGPENTPIGSIRRVSIENVIVYDAEGQYSSIISGIPGHPIEDVRISGFRAISQGGGSAELATREPPEMEKAYPEPNMFGAMPAYGFFIRHAREVEITEAKLSYIKPDARPAFVLNDVQDASFARLNLQRGTGNAPLFDLRNVTGLSVTQCRGLNDTRLDGTVTRQKL